MNKTIMALFGFCMATCFGCAGHKQSAPLHHTDKYITGAYGNYRALTDEELDLFKSVYPYEAALNPQSVATQVVAGTNYSFLCLNDSNREIKVVIFKPLPGRGNPQILRVEPLGYESLISDVTGGIRTKWKKMSTGQLGISSVFNYADSSLGYAVADINHDGIQELLLGCFWDDKAGYQVYDIYTMNTLTGNIEHVFCGGERDWCSFNCSGIVTRNAGNSAFDGFVKHYELRNSQLIELPEDVAVKTDLLMFRFEHFL